jgi:DNA polymerase I
MIYADTETHPISDAEPTPRLVVSGFASASAPDDVRLVLRTDTTAAQLETLLSGRLVWAGGSFDLLVWMRAFPSIRPVVIDALMAGRIHDVQIREKMIDHAYKARTTQSAYNLGAIARMRCGITDIDKSDPYRLLYGGLDGVPLEHWPEGAKAYARRDVSVLAPIFAEQEKHADLLTDEPRQVRAAFALAAMAARGMAVNRDHVRTLDRLFAEMRIEHEQALVRVGLARHKHKIKRPSPLVKSQKKARTMIVELARETGQEYLRTDTGLAALSEEALDKLHVPEGHPLQHYRALGSMASKRTTYLDPLMTDVVRGSYDSCLQTNRTSMYQPNLQNVPQNVRQWIPADRLPQISPGYMLDGSPIKPRPLGFRECLVPRPGHCFVISDWSMMELVCWAQTCLDWFGWSKLGDALRDGRDPHEEMGSTIAGFDIRGTDERKKWRTLAKAPNFGYPGGLGAQRFVDKYGAQVLALGEVLDIPRAKELKAMWKRQWPESVLYHKRIGRLTANGNATITLDRTGYTRGGMKFTEAANFTFQGLAAGVAKDALMACEIAHGDGQLGAPLLFVHDEIITESPIEHALEHAALQERIMLGALARLCPDVPGGVETMITMNYTK